MTEHELLKKKLRESRPVDWETLPDIQLYMDQLVSYMPRQLLDFESGETLTSAMVNNYIKAGLMPRATEKRYSREHIALLTAICVLKHVMTAKEISELFGGNSASENVADFYGNFCTMLDDEMTAVLPEIDGGSTKLDLYNAALGLAVGAYCRQLACKRIMESLNPKSKVDKK